MMLSVLLGLTAFQAPDLDKPLTLRRAAAPVSEVLAQVSKEVGFSFAVKEVRDWPIIVSVKSFRAGELLDRIAEVTDSEWVKEPERWVLTRSAARVKKSVDLENADRAARLKPVIDALPTELTQEAFDKAISEVNQEIKDHGGDGTTPRAIFGGPSPAIVLLMSAVKRMPVREIAEAPISSFISYSNDPRPGQRKLLPISNDVWNRYRSLRERFAKAVDVPLHLIMPAGMAKLPLPAQVRISLTFARPNAMADVYASLSVYDAEGNLLDNAKHTLSLVPPSNETSESPVKGAVEFTPEGRRLLVALRRTNAPSQSFNLYSTRGELLVVSAADAWLTPINIEAVRDAVQKEPMAFHLTDWLHDLASKSDRNLVAYVPDHAFGPLSDPMNGGADHASLWKALPQVGISASLNAEALVIKPRYFARSDRYRVNRKALRTFVDASGPYGLPSLAAISAYAAHSPPITYSGNLDNLLLELILRRQRSLLLDQTQVNALRLMHQWRTQSPGEEVLRYREAVARFGPAYEQLLRASVARLSAYRMVSGGREPSNERDYDPFAGPPLDPETPVIMERVVRSDGVVMVLEGGSVYAVSPRALGMYLGLKPENFTGFQPVRPIKNLHPATLVIRSVTMRSGRSGTTIEHTDADARYDQSLALDQLPATWAAEIEEGKKHSENVRATMGGSVPPP